jgi:DNA-binding YbaB/EbfC family protein
MNLQGMMQQAQKLQRDMMKEKKEIEDKIFSFKQSFVEVEANGRKEILKLKIDKDTSLEKDDLEMLEDMIVLAINETFKQVDKETEQRMGKFGSGVSGLF